MQVRNAIDERSILAGRHNFRDRSEHDQVCIVQTNFSRTQARGFLAGLPTLIAHQVMTGVAVKQRHLRENTGRSETRTLYELQVFLGCSDQTTQPCTDAAR